ncbi:MAG: hypothetical protein O3A97_05905 [Proteobacteria bacterium]|nr:hypothetical protein [Pseudomonadota bacterium]
MIWTFLGALICGYFGAGTGIVGAFGGSKGLIIFAAIGGVLGFFAAPDILWLLKRIVRTFTKG